MLGFIIYAQSIPLKNEESVENDSKSEEENGHTKAIEIIEVVDTILVPINDTKTDVTTEATKEDEHKIEKRSPLRGDNPDNNLLAGFEEESRYEDQVSGVAARKIKFLPTFLG